jgi:hypothetical protein
MPGDRRRHVAENNVSRATQSPQQLIGSFRRENIKYEGVGSHERFHFLNVNGDDLPTALRRSIFFHNYLGPASRGCTEIKHPLPALEKPKSLIKLQQFEGSARTVTLLAGFLNIWIIKLSI